MKAVARNLVIIALSVAATLTLRAGSTTVLEGFEEADPGMPPGTTTNGFSPNNCNFTAPNGSSRGFCNTNFSIFAQYGGRSSEGLVSNWQYTATGPNDPNVTEGTHSMAITFYQQGFGNDFQLVLSDTNSLLVEQAAASGQIGRYVLRYDMIFANPSQYGHFNQTAYIGASWDYLQISAALTNGLAVWSCALELPALGLPAPNSGTNVQIYFGNDFTNTQPVFTNCTVYLDNIRLVDTYASPSTTPVIYHLQSFENGIGATNLYPTVTSFYGNPCTARAVLSQYATNGLYDPTTNGVPNEYTINSAPYPTGQPSPYDTDFAVTDGTHALQVSNYGPIGYEADFAVSLAGTKLAQILSSNLPLSELAHYTLRWDTTMPAVPSFFDGPYQNFTYSSGAAAFPMAQSRRANQQWTGLQRDTYSLTLDQIAAWGASPIGGDPAVICFFDGAYIGCPYVYFYDNFELIDTAPSVVVTRPVITSIHYNPATHQVTLIWTSTPGALYTVQSSPTLKPVSFSSLATNIPSGGTTTTTTVTEGAGSTGFLRVIKQ